MIISKHQLSLSLRFLTLSILCTISQLNAQSHLTQLGPNHLTFASNAYFGENGRVFLSTSTGLYISDGGESWRKVNEAFNNVYFNDLKFTKGKNGRVYVWNRDQLWYTTDNGETWTNWFIFFEPAPFSHVNSMVVQGDTVFQALRGGLCYALNNNALAKPFSTFNGKNIVRVVVNGNSILAIGSDSKTYLSADRGITWNSYTDFPYIPGDAPLRRFDSKGAVLITADNSSIWFSADFGKTWTAKTSGLSSNPQIYLGDVVIDGNDVFTIAHSTLYKSSLDASGSWESVFTYTSQSPRYISIQGDKMMLTDWRTLMKSVDRGLTWPTPSLEGIRDYRFEYLYSGNSDGSIIAYGGSGMYKKRTTEKKFSSFLPIPNQVVFDGDVFYSGGPTILTRSAIDGTILHASPNIPDIYVYSSGDEVYHGKDAFFSLMPSKGIWKLNNENEWQEFNHGLTPNTVRDLKGNDNYVFTIVNNRDLYRSPDSSPDWVKMDFGKDLNLSEYTVNGSMVLVGGFASDIHLSKDNGTSWNRIVALNPSEGGVSALYIDTEYIMATTFFGEYLHASKDLGETWTKVSINNSLKYSLFVQSMTIANDSVYLGTNGNGIIAFAKTLLNKSNQTITFNTVEDKTLGDASFTLSATASSGLPVVFSTTSDKISINGNQVTMIKAGTANVTARQPGNDVFTAADPVTQTFCVNPPKPTIVVSDVSSGSVTLLSNASIGNQWYKNGTVITSATADRITVTEVGVYTVKVTVDNCSSITSDEQPIVITGDLKPHQATTNLVYPNPVRQDITVNLHAFDLNHDVEIIIYDAIGILKLHIIERGRESTTLSVDDFPTGLYVVKARQYGLSQTAKFLKD